MPFQSHLPSSLSLPIPVPWSAWPLAHFCDLCPLTWLKVLPPQGAEQLCTEVCCRLSWVRLLEVLVGGREGLSACPWSVCLEGDLEIWSTFKLFRVRVEVFILRWL